MISVNDIARLAQVDKSTVSMTLRNHPNARNLRAETRERIRRIAAAGYQQQTVSDAAHRVASLYSIDSTIDAYLSLYNKYCVL